MPSRVVRRDEGFGRRLVEAMTTARVRPGELARRVEVLPQTVSRWRSGELPDDLRLPQIAAVLGVREEWLKTGAGERSPEAQGLTGPGTRLRALEARLAFLRDAIRAYTRAGRVPPPEVLADWERAAADVLEATGKPAGPP